MEMKQKQEYIVIGNQEQQQIMCLSSASFSTDTHFLQKGEMIEVLDHGCYHNVQKPAAE